MFPSDRVTFIPFARRIRFNVQPVNAFAVRPPVALVSAPKADVAASTAAPKIQQHFFCMFAHRRFVSLIGSSPAPQARPKLAAEVGSIGLCGFSGRRYSCAVFWINAGVTFWYSGRANSLAPDRRQTVRTRQQVHQAKSIELPSVSYRSERSFPFALSSVFLIDGLRPQRLDPPIDGLHNGFPGLLAGS